MKTVCVLALSLVSCGDVQDTDGPRLLTETFVGCDLRDCSWVTVNPLDDTVVSLEELDCDVRDSWVSVTPTCYVPVDLICDAGLAKVTQTVVTHPLCDIL